MENTKKKRQFAERDKNVAVFAPRKSQIIRAITPAEGSENATKRRKIELKSEIVGFCLPKTDEVIPSTTESSEGASSVAADSVASDSQGRAEPISSSLEDLSLVYLEDVMKTEIELDRRLCIRETYCYEEEFTITAAQRERLVDWLIAMQVVFKVENEVLHLAVTLMDVFLSKENAPEDDQPAIVAACFWLAHKSYNGNLKSRSILRHCPDVSKQQLAQYERRILAVSEFKQYPNALTILHYYILQIYGTAPFPSVDYYISTFLQELMLLHADFTSISVSMRAVIALLTSLYLMQSDKLELLLSLIESSASHKVYKGHTKLLKVLRLVRDYSDFHKSSELMRKYSTRKYKRVSLHPSLDPDQPKLYGIRRDEEVSKLYLVCYETQTDM